MATLLMEPADGDFMMIDSSELSSVPGAEAAYGYGPDLIVKKPTMNLHLSILLKVLH